MNDPLPRSIVKSADWVLREERGPGVPEAIYGSECITCEARSPLMDNDALPIAVWSVQHTQDKPDHTLFLLRTEKHWRVHRREEPTPDTGTGARPVMAFLDKTFGPAFVGLMCLVTALTGYLIAHT